MRRLVAAFLPFSLTLFSACGGGGGGSIPLADLGNQVVSVQCAALVRCNAMPSMEACASTVIVGLDQLMADVASGKIHYDGAAAAECLAFVGGQGCNMSDAISSTPEACRRTFQGTIAEGAACADQEECLSERCENQSCDPVTECCVGTCGPVQPIIAVGGDCLGADMQCADGTFCKVTNPRTAVCTPKAKVGQPCDNPDECAAGLLCTKSDFAMSGVCTRFPVRGEPCTAALQCDSRADMCSPMSGTCVARLPPGEACLSDEDCVVYAQCDAATSACVTKGSRGALCGQGQACLDGLQCEPGTNTCAPPPSVQPPVCL